MFCFLREFLGCTSSIACTDGRRLCGRELPHSFSLPPRHAMVSRIVSGGLLKALAEKKLLDNL